MSKATTKNSRQNGEIMKCKMEITQNHHQMQPPRSIATENSYDFSLIWSIRRFSDKFSPINVMILWYYVDDTIGWKAQLEHFILRYPEMWTEKSSAEEHFYALTQNECEKEIEKCTDRSFFFFQKMQELNGVWLMKPWNHKIAQKKYVRSLSIRLNPPL